MTKPATMIAAAGSTLDPDLRLYSVDGVLIAQNDDSLDPQFGLTNARLERFPIRKDGTYTIEAGRSTDGVGNFSVTLRNTRSSS